MMSLEGLTASLDRTFDLCWWEPILSRRMIRLKLGIQLRDTKEPLEANKEQSRLYRSQKTAKRPSQWCS